MAHLSKERKKSILACNACGRVLRMENGISLEDSLQVSKEWGFFSKKDLEIHDFTLCEDCYNQLISNFKIPVEISDKKEAL